MHRDADRRTAGYGLLMGLNKLDLAIIALYLAGITLFGLRFRKKQRSLRDYFLADRDIPWWAISLSIVAAETSTLTIISIPGLAYDTNLMFLQVVMGYVVGPCHHQLRSAASLFSRRSVYRVRTDRAAIWQKTAFVDRRPFPDDPRRGRRRAESTPFPSWSQSRWGRERSPRSRSSPR